MREFERAIFGEFRRVWESLREFGGGIGEFGRTRESLGVFGEV